MKKKKYCPPKVNKLKERNFVLMQEFVHSPDIFTLEQFAKEKNLPIVLIKRIAHQMNWIKMQAFFLF